MPADETPINKSRDEAPASLLAQAIDAALEAGDLEGATVLMEEASRALFAGRLRVPLSRLEGWFARLGPRVQERPWLIFGQGWLWNTQRRLALAAVANARAERLFEAQPDEAERARGLTLVRLAQGIVAERAGNFGLARQAFGSAREVLGGVASRPESWDAADTERWRAHDLSGAASFYVEAIPVLRATSEPMLLARALNNFAHELLRRGEPALARRMALEAVELKRGLDDDASLANSLNMLGSAEQQLGMHEIARATLGESLRLAESSENRLIHAYALNNLAEVERDAGDFDVAEDLYERASVEKQDAKDEYGIAYGLRSLCVLKRRSGDLATARALLARGLELREPIADPYEAAQFRLEQALLHIAARDLVAARPLLDETAVFAEEIDAKALACVVRIADAALRHDDQVAAAALALIAHYRLDALMRPELTLLHRAEPCLASLGTYLARSTDRPAVAARAWVLGEFRLEIAGRAVDFSRWRSKRAAELVRILVANRQSPVHRDELIEWLWRGEPDALGRLNAAVNSARRGLEETGGPGGWIVRDGDRYRLERLEWVDADAFVDRYETARNALAADDASRAHAALRTAASLLRGEPYSADRYAEWAARERARLMELAQLLRERVAAVSLELGLHDEALLSAQEAVDAEPARESAHQLVIRAHLARGDHASALRALAQCRDALRRELGVAPSPRTEGLLATPRKPS